MVLFISSLVNTSTWKGGAEGQKGNKRGGGSPWQVDAFRNVMDRCVEITRTANETTCIREEKGRKEVKLGGSVCCGPLYRERGAVRGRSLDVDSKWGSLPALERGRLTLPVVLHKLEGMVPHSSPAPP